MASSDDVEVGQETQAMDTEDAYPSPPSGTGQAGPARLGVALNYGDRYKMDHSSRGTAVIICNNQFKLRKRVIDRRGSDVDVAELNKCFKNLGFRNPQVFLDLTCENIRTLLRNVARMDHSDSDMLVCAILTHGEEGKIYGVDDKMDVEELLAPFKDPACTLMGKPKFFIVQATDQSQGFIEVDAAGEHAPAMRIQPTKYSYRIPTEADFLIAYAPAYGIYSSNGTSFIKHLASELEQIDNREIMQVMTRVSGLVSEENSSAAVQRPPLRSTVGLVPCITTMLTKDLYFN